MTVDKGLRLVSNAVVLLTVGMAHPKCPLFVSTQMLWVTALVAALQIQSVFTGFCPGAMVLRKLGLKDA